MMHRVEDLTPSLTYTMPFSNVLHLPFPDKVRATRLAGFHELAIQPQEVARIAASGLSIQNMRLIAEDNGIKISRLDPLCTWNPNWHPNNMDDSFIADHSTTALEFFEIASELGCTHMSLNATFTANAYALDELVSHYAEICRLAHEEGIVCDLEPIPMWGVTSLEQGWEIVERAGAPNGGLVLDTLHFVRSESKLETLATIPGSSIHCVQICDGIHPLKSGVTLEADCFERMWPGTGNFPLADIVSGLHKIGGLNGVGPEVFSVLNQNMATEDVARLCKQSLLAYAELRV